MKELVTNPLVRGNSNRTCFVVSLTLIFLFLFATIGCEELRVFDSTGVVFKPRPHNPATCKNKKDTWNNEYHVYGSSFRSTQRPSSKAEAKAWNASHKEYDLRKKRENELKNQQRAQQRAQEQKRLKEFNQRKIDIQQMLFVACKKNSSSAKDIGSILELGVNEDQKAKVNQPDQDGFTALMLASRYVSDPEVIDVLVSAGAEVDGWSPDMSSEFKEMILKDKPPLLRQVWEQIFVQRYSLKMTPLMFASMSNEHEEIVAALIDAGAQVDLRNDNGMSPLMFASSLNSNAKIISILNSEGGNINARNQAGQTLLHAACQLNSSPSVIKILLELGIKVNSKDIVGSTPIMLAAGYNTNPMVIEVLIRAGSDVNELVTVGAEGEFNSFNPLVAASLTNSNPKVISALLRHGARVNERVGDRLTALHAAIAFHQLKIADLLLNAGAEINAQDVDLLTPLHWAATGDEPEAISYLLSRGADPTIKDIDGETALDLARENPAFKNTEAYWELNDATYD